MTSIRQRTLTLILGLLFLGLLIMTAVNLHDSNHEIDEVYDAQLAQNARLLQGVMRMPMASKEQAELYQAFNQALGLAVPKVDGHPYESKIAFQVWNSDGTLLVHTASAPAFTSPPSKAGFSAITDVNNRAWRAFVLEDAQYNLKIWVGERDDVRDDLVNRIVRHTVLPNLIGCVLLAAVIWLAIGWGLKPLVNMAQTLRARHPGSLEPLHLNPLPTELEPMQAALNRVLAQIQEVMGRERRFIADAAHEMRTPLAVLKVHAENLKDAASEDDRRASLEHLMAGVDRTTRLVNQLLTMARIEPRTSALEAPKTDLVATVRDSLVQMTPWLLSKELELVFDPVDEVGLVKVDTGIIQIALNNLVSNAANFSPPGGLITVGLAKHHDHYELSVEDQGPGIDEAERDRLFERFYSRGNDHGAGLGLTIVQSIANRLGGQVRLENRPSGGLRATFEFARL
ncbi:two-component sensor histidine kinase [Pseudomonas fluorescens]|jgi:two-component system, OmpR family, sensor histidine kinase QseC|uniref:histidine kinase n=1 Tax=Pseudomonas shahriarae TaxID=2745512 RepID=A0ABT5N6Y1_9PSED|nr:MULTISPECIES: ATP-binding protein [Pseudomonas]AYG08957.1 two-component sensor histidine kinase [Pseudomonas fluorescens]OAE17675.1 two-component sensor histidine kinase [Pseudomonas brenneri]MBJ2242708.1 sensor histidine kinase N-terminal domain-containing protein [Pseudomonas sp. MF6768]MBJ2253903.1 sensor histidine kinase N-terminal domain-containing protein [Pseudomonas sp. MF6784]MBJ2270196.1 sensor histidine kinase N-terminal domain-containing protein [Pseudomonas sp. MF6772]